MLNVISIGMADFSIMLSNFCSPYQKGVNKTIISIGEDVNANSSNMGNELQN